MQRADDGELVHHLGKTRQVLANLDPGHVGRDRVEFAPDPGGSLGLEIEHVLVRRAADQVDEDHRFGRGPFALGGLGGQQAGQAQPGSQATDLEEVAARQSVTERVGAAGWSEDLQHGKLSDRFSRES